MEDFYLNQLENSLKNPSKEPKDILEMMNQMEFFFKILKVKVESKDPNLQKQALEELKALQTLLKKHQK